MVITMQSKQYSPNLVTARYVSRSPVGEEYRFSEVGSDQRYNIRRGSVTAGDLPPEVRAAADAQRHQAFGSVPWPLTPSAEES